MIIDCKLLIALSINIPVTLLIGYVWFFVINTPIKDK